MKALPPDLIGALRKLDTGTVCNAIGGFGVRLKNEGFADSSVCCLTPPEPPPAGFAATVRIRCPNPPEQGIALIEFCRSPQFSVERPREAVKGIYH